MNEFISKWMKMSADERQNLTPEENRYFLDDQFLRKLRAKIKDDEIKKYIYLVTFTLDPEKNKDLPKEELEEVVTNLVEAQATRIPLKITYYAYSKEYTKAGQAHWHAVVQTKKPLPKNRFAYYQRSYGNIDISRTKTTTTLEALDYISKDVLPKVLIDENI